MIGLLWRVVLRRSLGARTVEAVEHAAARLEDSTRKLRRLERKLLELERRTAQLLGKIAAQVDRARAIAETTAEEIKQAEQAVEQAERAMELLRTERQSDAVAVETLTARIKEYQALSEANIAAANHRRGQLSPGD